MDTIMIIIDSAYPNPVHDAFDHLLEFQEILCLSQSLALFVRGTDEGSPSRHQGIATGVDPLTSFLVLDAR